MKLRKLSNKQIDKLMKANSAKYDFSAVESIDGKYLSNGTLMLHKGDFVPLKIADKKMDSNVIIPKKDDYNQVYTFAGFAGDKGNERIVFLNGENRLNFALKQIQIYTSIFNLSLFDIKIISCGRKYTPCFFTFRNKTIDDNYCIMPMNVELSEIRKEL